MYADLSNVLFVNLMDAIKMMMVTKEMKWERIQFDTEQKSSKFLLEIMTLVSSANNTSSDTEFILRGCPCGHGTIHSKM